MTRTPTRYEFGDFALDVGQQRLVRRDGEAIVLTARVFETLVCLVERAGETVDKDVLLHLIWPDVIVEENSLTQNVSTLRHALGETRGENRYIATVARRGYRFVAQVTRHYALEPADTAPSAAVAPSATLPGLRPGRFRVVPLGFAAMLVLAVAVGFFFGPLGPKRITSSQSLAILPFKPLLPAQRDESLELGMTESLISSLGRYSTPVIAPLSSVRRYGALNQDPLTAGRELHVDSVLDGSLQRTGERLRVSVRLLRVADGQQLWAQAFDQDFTTIFDVQDTIAARVAQALSARWIGNASSRGAPYTKDPEAYALYASGRLAWTRQTEVSLLAAIKFFQQAIARDPNYALAYSGLADSYAVLGVFGMRAPHEVFPQARKAVEKALSIDPNLAAAHSALGHIKVQYEHDWEGGAQEYARAIALDPTLALTYHRRALLYAMQGDLKSAMSASERAQQLEPLWLAPRIAFGNFLFYSRRYDESIQRLDQILALDDRSDSARSTLVRNLIAKGDYARALAEIDRRPIQAPGSNAFRAQVLALSGQREKAMSELDRVLEQSKERYVAAYDIALIYAALGEPEKAFLWLEHAMEDRSTLINFLAEDPMLDPVRGDARFSTLVRRVGIYGRVLQ